MNAFKAGEVVYDKEWWTYCTVVKTFYGGTYELRPLDGRDKDYQGSRVMAEDIERVYVSFAGIARDNGNTYAFHRR